jgi:quercetin dioxygenase-like cupin family protein
VRPVQTVAARKESLLTCVMRGPTVPKIASRSAGECRCSIRQARPNSSGKSYQDHGRSVQSLFHGPSLRAMLTVIVCGRRTGERRVADTSTVHVLEGEVRFQAGEVRHVLSAGGTLVLEGNVPYETEALSDAAFLHTLVLSGEEVSAPPSVHPTEPAEGRGSGSSRG